VALERNIGVLLREWPERPADADLIAVRTVTVSPPDTVRWRGALAFIRARWLK
jgi:hypothetical protein